MYGDSKLLSLTEFSKIIPEWYWLEHFGIYHTGANKN